MLRCGVNSTDIITSTPNLIARYQASVGVLNPAGTPAVNGDTVATWKDQSGNTNTATQTVTANMPIFQSTGGPGGTSDVRFNGSSSAMSTPSINLGTAASFFAVINFVSFGGVLFGGAYGIDYISYVDSTNINIAAGGQVVGVAHGMTTGTWYVIGCRRNGTSGDWSINSTTPASRGTASNASMTGAMNVSELGAYANATFFVNALVVEYDLYSRYLSNSEFSSIMNALRTGVF